MGVGSRLTEYRLCLCCCAGQGHLTKSTVFSVCAAVLLHAVRGLERPFSRDQLFTTVLHCLLVVYFIALCTRSFAPGELLIAVLVPFCILQLVLFTAFFYVSYVDPAQVGGI